VEGKNILFKVFITFFLLLLLPSSLEAREIVPVLKEENEIASLLDKHLEEQIRELNLEGLDRYLQELEREAGAYLPSLRWRE
jgi:hypothetical protein